MSDDQHLEPSDKDLDATIAHDQSAVSREPSGATDASDETVTLADGRARPVDEPEERLFGDYQLLEEIARGGMGVVYKARQKGLNRVVALKMIRSGELAGEEDVRRFQVEAEAAAQLDHVAIVPVYEVGEVSGRHFYSMGFVEGPSLAERLRQGPMSPRQAARLLLAVAEAIDYAHQQGVIHRDLKPANILLVDGKKAESSATDKSSSSKLSLDSATSGFLPSSWRGGSKSLELLPKVTDFGLAKQVHSESDLTSTGQILGTPSYMPPEQAQGNANVGPSADIYSLGAVLYACLCGRPPFQAANVIETIQQVVEQEAVPLVRLNPGIARDLDTICLKCLEKAPEKRYENAAALAADLRHYLNGEPIKARPIKAPERIWRWCLRKPAVAASIFALAATLATLLVLGVVSLQLRFSRERATRLQEVADLRAERLDAANELADSRKQFAATQEYFALLSRVRERAAQPQVGWAFTGIDDLTRAAAIDAANKDVVALRTEAARCLTGVDLRKAAEVSMPAGYRSHLVAFSPDGSMLAAATLKSRFKVYVLLCNAATGELVHSLVVANRTPLQLDGVRHMEFLSAGQSLAITTRGGQLHRWDLTSDKPSLTTTRMPHGSVKTLVFQPGGSRAFYSTGGKIYLWSDLGESKAEPFFDGGAKDLCSSYDGRWLAALVGSSVNIFDARTMKLVQKIDRGGSLVRFSRDGRRIAIVWQEQIAIADAESGQVIRTMTDPQIEAVHEGIVRRTCFSSEGSLLVTGGGDQKLKIWDVNSGKLLLRIFIGGSDELHPEFSPDGKHLATGGNRRATLFEIGGPDLQGTMCDQGRALAAFTIVPGRDLALTAHRPVDQDRLAISLWNGAGAMVDRWTAPQSVAEDEVSVSSNGRTVAVGAARSIAAWDLPESAGASPHDSTWPALAHPNLLLFRGEQYIRIYGRAGNEAEAGTLKSLGIPWKSVDAALCWGNGLAYFFHGDEFCEFEISTGRVAKDPKKIRDHWPGVWEEGVDAAMLNHNGRVYFFKGEQYMRFNVAEHKVDSGYPKEIRKYFPRTFTEHVDAVLDYSAGVGGVRFLQGEEVVRFIDSEKAERATISDLFPELDTSRRIDAAVDLSARLRPRNSTGNGWRKKTKAPTGPLVLTPDGLQLWSILNTDRLASWEMPDFQERTTWSNQRLGGTYGVATIAGVDAGDEHLVIAAKSGFMYLMDPAEGKPKSSVAVPGRPSSITLSEDEMLAACGSEDGKAIVVRLPSGEKIAKLEGHRDVVSCVAFAPADQLLATASRDESIRLWRQARGGFELFMTLEAPGPIESIQFDARGERLIGRVTREATLRVWDLTQLKARLADMRLGW